MEDYVIDAKGETLGRIATRAAHVLQSKDLPSYAPHKLSERKVIIKNADQVKVTGKKAEQKIYYRHSGRPGHLKKTVYKAAFSRSPEWVVRHAISGMLPKNRLRSKRLAQVTFE